MDIEFFDSSEEMFEAERKARESADSKVRPVQARIKPGQYFINFQHGPELPIFGEVLDISKLGHNEEEQEYVNQSYAQPHMKNYRPTKAYSAACEWGEIGDIHLSVVSAIIDKPLFEYYQEHNWSPPTKMDRVQSRISWLLEELSPLFQHSDLYFNPHSYHPRDDILYIEICPASSPNWARTCHEFAKAEGMKYDRETAVYQIDGQPRVSYSGQVWARYVSHFEDGSRVALHIWSQQPDHEEAEVQLARLYGIFQEKDGLEPVEVFRKYF